MTRRRLLADARTRLLANAQNRLLANAQNRLLANARNRLLANARRLAARAVYGPRRPGPTLAQFAPRSTLELPAERITRAAIPAIDVHNHLGRWLRSDGGWMTPDVGRLLAQMDEGNLRSIVNLDGRWGTELEENLDRYDRAHPGRFATFAHVDWRHCADDNFARLATDFTTSIERGACGLKVWKDLGKSVRDSRGALVLPDDPRLDPLWSAAGAADVPVLIHVADPVAYFQPVDRHNERVEELRRFPTAGWLRSGLPTHSRLMSSLSTLADRHPDTTFIAAHVAGYSENLGWVRDLLTAHANVVIDIAARAGDLGRQPRAAAALINAFPDRVLFGSDVYPFRPEEVEIYFRLLESSDESFPYSAADPPPRGRWQISGLALEADVLAQVYAGNAARLLPALR